MLALLYRPHMLLVVPFYVLRIFSCHTCIIYSTAMLYNVADSLYACAIFISFNTLSSVCTSAFKFILIRFISSCGTFITFASLCNHFCFMLSNACLKYII